MTIEEPMLDAISKRFAFTSIHVDGTQGAPKFEHGSEFAFWD